MRRRNSPRLGAVAPKKEEEEEGEGEEEDSKRKCDVSMSAVYRHCTVRCVLQLPVTRCCLRITTSPNSVEKP